MSNYQVGQSVQYYNYTDQTRMPGVVTNIDIEVKWKPLRGGGFERGVEVNGKLTVPYSCRDLRAICEQCGEGVMHPLNDCPQSDLQQEDVSQVAVEYVCDKCGAVDSYSV